MNVFILGAGRLSRGLFFGFTLSERRTETFGMMANGVRREGILLFAGLFLVGCAVSSSPVRVTQKPSGKTTYETREMRLEDIQLTEGLQRENRYYMRISGTCTGEDCVPSSYSLAFIKEGPQSVTLDGREVTLTVGSETLEWEDPQARETNRAATIRSGVFARVDVSSKQLSTIGGSSKMRGSVGGARFTLPHRNRSPIRTLLSRLEKTSSASSDDSSSGKSR